MGFLITPMALAHPLHPIKAGRGISAETRGLDDVFPSDDLYGTLFLRDTHTNSWYGHAGVLDDLILLLFPVWFQVYISVVLFSILYIIIWI